MTALATSSGVNVGTSTWTTLTTTSTTPNSLYVTGGSTTGYTVSPQQLLMAAQEAAFFALTDEAVQQYIDVADKFDFKCKDGTVLHFDHGDVTIQDENAKIIYKSNPIREFNKYLNASDLLEEFISFCDEQKVRKNEFMKLPIELFIMWLVVRAADQDGEPDHTTQLLLEDASKKKRVQPKCGCCGKFLPKHKVEQGINFCNGEHLDRFMSKKLIAA